jgi:hypothetical protein
MLKTELRRTASCRIYQSLLFFFFFNLGERENRISSEVFYQGISSFLRGKKNNNTKKNFVLLMSLFSNKYLISRYSIAHPEANIKISMMNNKETLNLIQIP